MLPSQRELFDIPRDVCWLNAAAWSPLPIAARDAGQAAVLRKVHPWEMRADQPNQQIERARTGAARLIGADPNDVAVISSVSYGVATAGKILPLPRGSRVLILQDDHTSPVLEWMERCKAAGATLETIARPEDGDWTSAVLSAIARPGAPVAVVSISCVHWSDGGLIDLERVAPAVRSVAAALVVDATHAAGVIALNVQALDPDVLIFPTYKWVLGPYGRAFVYIAKRWQDSTPLEQISAARRVVNSEATPYIRDAVYVESARRFDMGERDHFISMEMASIGMEMMASWGSAAITERLLMLTRRLADGLRNSGALVPEERVRAPHILSLDLPGRNATEIGERLAAQKVYASPRLGRLRIAPHVYNDEADVDRFVEVVRTTLA